jgi:hypothetical protein
LSRDRWRSYLRRLDIVPGLLCMGGGLMNRHVLKERMKIATDVRPRTAR